jgi:hypothetical protein
LKVIQLLRRSPFGIEGSYLLCFRFQLFKPSLPIPTAEFRVKAFVEKDKAGMRGVFTLSSKKDHLLLLVLI